MWRRGREERQGEGEGGGVKAYSAEIKESVYVNGGEEPRKGIGKFSSEEESVECRMVGL